MKYKYSTIIIFSICLIGLSYYFYLSPKINKSSSIEAKEDLRVEKELNDEKEKIECLIETLKKLDNPRLNYAFKLVENISTCSALFDAESEYFKALNLIDEAEYLKQVSNGSEITAMTIARLYTKTKDPKLTFKSFYEVKLPFFKSILKHHGLKSTDITDTTSMCTSCPVGILQNEIVEEYRKKIHGFDTQNNVFVH